MDAPNTSQLPFVSAVCVTGKSKYHVEKLLPQAIKSFKEQAYAPGYRRLIVVHDDHEAAVRSVVTTEGAKDPWSNRIQLVGFEEKQTLGALRNAGLNVPLTANDELLIQWDDDDWHHPQRIAQQVDAYMSRGRALEEARACMHPAARLPVFLKRQLCYDVQRDVAFVRELPNTCIHGSILHANTPDLKPYPEQGKEEDTLFIKQWPHVFVMDNAPELYVRFFHGDEYNTWDRTHVMREAADYRSGTWAISEEQGEYLKEVLRHYGWPHATAFRADLPVGCDTDRRVFKPEDCPILKTPDGPPPPPVLPPLHDPPPFQEHHQEEIALIKGKDAVCVSSYRMIDGKQIPSTSIPVLTADGPADRDVVGEGRQDGQGVVPSTEDEQGGHEQCSHKQRCPFFSV